MKLNKINKDVHVKLERDELLVLNAALNEVCNGIDIFEFEMRIGVSRAHVEILMSKIHAILDQTEKHQDQ